MQKQFKAIRAFDPVQYITEMNAASAEGMSVEACGVVSGTGFWAILSRPANAGKPVIALTQDELNLARALADCDLNVSATARIMGRSRDMVQFRINALHKRTGLNPLSFYDLNELLYAEPEEQEDGQ